jgi:hypothetical protein
MSEYSGLSKDDFGTLMESYEKDKKSIYINGSDNEVKDSVNTRITSEKSKIPPKNTKK